MYNKDIYKVLFYYFIIFGMIREILIIDKYNIT